MGPGAACWTAAFCGYMQQMTCASFLLASWWCWNTTCWFKLICLTGCSCCVQDCDPLCLMAADGSRFNFVGAAAVASGRVSADTALVPPDAVGDAAAVPLSGAQVANQVLLQVRPVPACSSGHVTGVTTRRHGPVLRPELAAPWKGPAQARSSGDDAGRPGSAP